MGLAPILIYQNRESTIIMNNYRDISIRDDELNFVVRSIEKPPFEICKANSRLGGCNFRGNLIYGEDSREDSRKIFAFLEVIQEAHEFRDFVDPREVAVE